MAKSKNFVHVTIVDAGEGGTGDLTFGAPANPFYNKTFAEAGFKTGDTPVIRIIDDGSNSYELLKIRFTSDKTAERVKFLEQRRNGKQIDEPTNPLPLTEAAQAYYASTVEEQQDYLTAAKIRASDDADATLAAKETAESAAVVAVQKKDQATTDAQTASDKAAEATTDAQTASDKAAEATTDAQIASDKAAEATTDAQTASDKAAEATTDAQTASDKAAEATTDAQTASDKATDATNDAAVVATKKAEATTDASTVATKATEATDLTATIATKATEATANTQVTADKATEAQAVLDAVSDEMTPAEVKNRYEQNANTNALTDARAAKVDALDQGTASTDTPTFDGVTISGATGNVYKKEEVDNLISALSNGLHWKPGVATVADLDTTYPAPEEGWTASVDDENAMYRYDADTTDWIRIASGDTPLATAVLNGLMSAADKAKLDGVEAGAQVNHTAAEILALLLTVDGAGSGIDADKLDGFHESVNADPYTIARRNSQGDVTMRYAYTQYVHTDHGVGNRYADTVFYSSNDNFIRKNTRVGLLTSLSLENVDNTADADKPVSTAQQAALDTKLDKVGGTVVGNVTILNKNISLKSDDNSANGLLRFYDQADNQCGQIYGSAAELKLWAPVGVSFSAPYVSFSGDLSVSGAISENGTNLSAKYLGIGASAVSAAKWETARTFTINGDASGNVSMDGSGDVTLTLSVADNSHGHTWGNISAKPTTLAGYGITDAYTKAETYTQSEVDNLISALSNGLHWKPGVATVADLDTTYPAPEEGWTASVDDENAMYRYDADTTDWIRIASGDTPLATAVLNGLMSAADKAKLDGVEAGAQVNHTAAEILALLLTVDGTGSGLDADKLAGFAAETAATGNTIAKRNSDGDLNMRYGFTAHIHMNHGTTTRTTDTVFYSSDGGYIYRNTRVGFLTSLSLQNVDNTADADKPVSTAQQAALDAKLNKAGGNLTGAVNFGLGAVATALDFADGNSGSKTITADTTFTFANVPASGTTAIYTLVLTDGGAHTVTWPGSIKWDAATAPTLQAAGTDILTFITVDGGTTFFGIHSWTEA